MFASEKELVKIIKKNCNHICTWNTARFKTKILEEVDLGFGVADLVITKLSSKVKSTSTYLNHFDAIVYKIIETEKQITFEKIKEITKANHSSINSSLFKLINDSYIKQNDSLIMFRKAYEGIAKDSIAIEAKLKNWKRALDQAFRYKWFAEKTFVILDSAYISPAAKNIDKFKLYNVGLAEIDNKGKIILHFNPIKSDPIDATMWMLLNEQLKKSLSTKQKRFPNV